MNERTQIWNCGGGTQSTAIAVLIATGRLPKPDLSVIADTGRECSSTWEYLDRHTIPMLRVVGVELHRVKKSDWTDIDLWGGKDGKTILIPAYTTAGPEVGKLPNFCTNEWKVRPIQRWATHVHGVTAATQWLGISTDEAKRRANSFGAGKWMKRFPLIELGISRADCYAIVARHGLPSPPRSRCWLCPNQEQGEWRDTQENRPGEFALAAATQTEIQKIDPHAWLHPDAKPLAETDLTEANASLFGGCDSGMCFT